jgi:4-diphosphocytidyl-2-C-methyl-D-erythritol kinase
MGRTYRNILCPAKVNLVLKIAGPDARGFHPLESLMVKVNWGDRISLNISRSSATSINLSQTEDLGIPAEKNLVHRAAARFCEEYGVHLKISATLSKRVPTGAGLGGGSSDAAETLKLLWKFLYGKRSYDKKLFEIASGLGADVPFFLGSAASWCTGYGENLKSVEIPKLHFVLLFPDVNVATPWAYRELDCWREKNGIKPRLLGLPDWLGRRDFEIPDLVNDFEGCIFSKKPGIQRAREALARYGARAARMSGSGSTVFGIFSGEKSAKLTASRLRAAGWRALACKSL